MQTAHSRHADRGLFSTRYLDALPELDAWNAVSDDERQAAYDEITTHWNGNCECERERESGTDSSRTGTGRAISFVEAVFRTLGHHVERRGEQRQRQPAYGLFDAAEAAREATGRAADGAFDESAIAVADVRAWERPLDSRGSDDHERGFEIPSAAVHRALQTAPVSWAVLTNGTQWRLYHDRTSHRLDACYEVDLSVILETGDMAAFTRFYRLFRHEAFLKDASGDCPLDTLSDACDTRTREQATELCTNIVEAAEILAAGFIDHPENDLDPTTVDAADRKLLRDSSFSTLYRLLAGLCAERDGDAAEVAGTATGPETDASTGPATGTDSLHALVYEIARQPDREPPPSHDRQPTLFARLAELVPVIDRGPDSADSSTADRTRAETRFLATHEIDDATLARAIDRLTRLDDPAGETRRLDAAALDVRHLGSICERLRGYQLTIDDEPRSTGEETSKATGDEPRAAADDAETGPTTVSLTAGSGKRKSTGSYYTPAPVVEYIVDRTLGPLVADATTDLTVDETYASQVTDRILELDVLDPAMGSGYVLLRALDYLTGEIIDAQTTQAAECGLETIDRTRDLEWVRRQVATHCLYGVDLNPVAVELATLSLWLRTGPHDRPVAAFDRRLKTGNALVGIDRREDLPSADGDWRADRDRLDAIATVKTAAVFGLDDCPDDPVERLTAAVGDDDAWERLADTQWFADAQRRARVDRYLHWPLAFPEIYDETARPGFDAVIGNPPWVATAGRTGISATIDTDLRSYLEATFETTVGQFDLYVAFTEHAVAHSRDGRIGLILPDSVLTREQNEPLREYLLSMTSLSELVRIGTAFEGVETGAICLVTGGDDTHVRCGDATTATDLSSLSYTEIHPRVFARQDATRFLIYLDAATRSILATLEGYPELGKSIDISRGEELSKRAAVLDTEPAPATRPIAPGSAIRRYAIDDDELRYIVPEDIDKADRTYRSPKLVFRQTGDSLVGTYDPDSLVTIKSAYNVHSETGTDTDSADTLKHVLGVLNSSVLDFYHYYTHAAYRSVFPQLNQSTIETVPVPIEAGPDPRLVDLVETQLELHAERAALSLCLDAHLGSYEFGPTVGELPHTRPADDVSTTKLTSTTTEWPNLRLGTVDVTSRTDTLVITATARYKPIAGGVDTDRWGYAETPPIPAIEYTDRTDGYSTLVEAFVPYAVDTGNGFASARTTATRSHSLLDRLQAITLPRLEDVADGLAQYDAERTRAAELDRRLAATDRAVDNRVCSLYDLTTAERDRIYRDRAGD